MDNDSNVVRIVAQLDYDHNGNRESTKPVVFALHDALLALAEKYDGL